MKVFSQKLLNAGGNQVISSNVSAATTNNYSSIEDLISIDIQNSSKKFLALSSGGIYSSQNGLSYSKLLDIPTYMSSQGHVLLQAYTNTNYNIGILFYLDSNQRKTRIAGFSDAGVINNAATLNYMMNPQDCIYYDDKYYLVGYDDYSASTSNGYLFVGDNVQTWTDPIILPNEYQPKHIVYGNDMFVIANSGSCIYSADGTNFSQPVVFPTSIGGILYDKGYFYILGYNGIYRSKNLYNWTKLYDGNYSSSKACIGMGKLAILKTSGSIVSPSLNLITTINYTDFKNVEVSSSASGNDYNAIAYGNKMFSIIGGNKAYNMMWGIEE